jgi:hypothetical protein
MLDRTYPMTQCGHFLGKTCTELDNQFRDFQLCVPPSLCDSCYLKDVYLQFCGLFHIRRGFEVSGEAMNLGIDCLSIHLVGKIG